MRPLLLVCQVVTQTVADELLPEREVEQVDESEILASEVLALSALRSGKDALVTVELGGKGREAGIQNRLVHGEASRGEGDTLAVHGSCSRI